MAKRKKRATKKKAAPRTSAVPKDWPAAKVERRRTSALIPYARNAKTHSEAQVKQLAASITEWGWTNPVLVDEGDRIIAGHGRVLAAELLGISVVPVTVARAWTEAQVKAYAIADNKLTESPWDKKMLALEMAELGDLDFDLSLTGFAKGDIGRIALFGAEPAQDAGPQPVKKKAVSRSGDIWVLGDHQLRCGDCTADEAWGDEKASMVWTDPPYGVDYVGKTKDALEIQNDGEAGLEKLLTDAFGQALRRTKGGAPWYVASPPGKNSITFLVALERIGVLRQTLIWAKGVMVMGRSDFHYRHEPILYGWSPGASHPFYGDRKNDTVWEVDRPTKSKDHTTMKPLELITRALDLSSQPGELVVDPFSGSGSTLIACEQTNRRCYAIEIDPRYVDSSARRWEETTGHEAVLEGDGRTFAQVAKARK